MPTLTPWCALGWGTQAAAYRRAGGRADERVGGWAAARAGAGGLLGRLAGVQAEGGRRRGGKRPRWPVGVFLALPLFYPPWHSRRRRWHAVPRRRRPCARAGPMRGRSCPRGAPARGGGSGQAAAAAAPSCVVPCPRRAAPLCLPRLLVGGRMRAAAGPTGRSSAGSGLARDTAWRQAVRGGRLGGAARGATGRQWRPRPKGGGGGGGKVRGTVAAATAVRTGSAVARQ